MQFRGKATGFNSVSSFTKCVNKPTSFSLHGYPRDDILTRMRLGLRAPKHPLGTEAGASDAGRS